MEDKIANLRSLLYAAKTDYQRVGHRAIQVAHNILVFGGTNANNEFVTSVLRINC
jgi:phosphate uptake regulator